eukprot:TRINITY_DN4096_c0_g1_i11.p1 TRINITY_DN4096_c0_g1~~TRINITY_DN4096_c0_g1_i11.p1  ORF type:complete len:308 (+),score=40.71 TRINITY_DN4096_c0_g1_i11:749-1672(+)
MKRRMQLKKLSLTIFFILSAASIVRLLRFVSNTSSSPPPLTRKLSVANLCRSPSNTCGETTPSSRVSDTPIQHINSSAVATLTNKEFRLLADLISVKAPCNMLVFGLGPQSLQISLLNTGGTTIFLEDDVEKIKASAPKFKATQIYKVEHRMAAGEAYELLRQARKDPSCTPHARPLQASRCPLALTSLPKVVYDRKWDVVMIDGPIGDGPEAPGRMAVIYSAGILARAGNMTDVVVHDIDRTVEKWYSWEYLCEENLISSKGKLWHFRIVGDLKSTSFCPNTTFHTSFFPNTTFHIDLSNSSVMVR